MKFDFCRQIFRKILEYQISLKSVLWEPSCSMRTDGQIGTTKLVVTFRDYANVPVRKRELCPHFEGV